MMKWVFEILLCLFFYFYEDLFRFLSVLIECNGSYRFLPLLCSKVVHKGGEKKSPFEISIYVFVFTNDEMGV